MTALHTITQAKLLVSVCRQV